MSPHGRKEMSRRAISLWSSNSKDKAETLFSKDYVNHQESDVTGGVTARSLAQYGELLKEYRAAFAKSQVDILMQIEEGPLVATRWRFTATHTGNYMGKTPTGKTISWTGVQIDRFDNAKIVESWVDWDKYLFFQGVGMVS